MKCLNCGKDLEQTIGKRERRFCDSTCRSNYWQKQKRLKKERKYPLEPKSALKLPKDFVDVKKIAVVNKEGKIKPILPEAFIRTSKPERMKGEDSLDYSARVNMWKKQQTKNK